MTHRPFSFVKMYRAQIEYPLVSAESSTPKATQILPSRWCPTARTVCFFEFVNQLQASPKRPRRMAAKLCLSASLFASATICCLSASENSGENFPATADGRINAMKQMNSAVAATRLTIITRRRIVQAHITTPTDDSAPEREKKWKAFGRLVDICWHQRVTGWGPPKCYGR